MGNRKQLRILIVDDDANACSALAELLRDAGYHTEVAADGHGALGVLERVACDVLLTDAYLPELNGLLLADRAAAQQPGLHVLFMSAAPPLGHGAWFSKPIDLPALLAALARLQLERTASA